MMRKCKESWRNGYMITVRNKYNLCYQKKFLPEKMKNAYVEKFGDIIIFNDEYDDWYCDILDEKYYNYKL